MKITEKNLRKVTRQILTELFTRKSKLGMGAFLGDKDTKINPFDYGGEGGESMWEVEESLEEEEKEEEE